MITLPIFLFLLLAFGFWILVDSKFHLAIRLACIVGLFFFGMVFWNSTSSFMGWPANGTKIYGVPVIVFSVLIDEPTEKSKGGIFVTVRQPSSLAYKSIILRSFGYPIKSEDPRLYRFNYSREMHEGVEEQISSKLKQGQRGVRGTFKDPNAREGEGKEGEGKGGEKGKSDGSQSQESKSKFFHNLVPRHEYDKNNPAPAKKAPRYVI